MDLQKQVEKKNKRRNSTAHGGAAAAAVEGISCGVMWERFLPKMTMRVLLVESDDSTRHIISALLRKCSYKGWFCNCCWELKVFDGLLYLLFLLCKNHNLVVKFCGTYVFFLLKPVAAVADGLKAWEVLKEKPHSVDLILTEVELPSISGYALLTLIMEHDVCKNIPIIMMSSKDSISTVYKCMLRGAADFLVKPVRKNELRNLWQHSSNSAGLGPPAESIAQQKVEATAENNALSNHSSGYMACIQRNRECIEKGSDAQSSCTKPELEIEGAKCLTNDTNTEAHDNRVLESSSREAIDLIGSFDKNLKSSFGSFANVSTNRFDILPVLDLSLRGSSYPTSSVNDERDMLNLSNASAFSRYINKPIQAPNSISPGISNQQKDHETNFEKQFSSHTPDYNSDFHHQREIEINAYSSLIPPTYYTQLDTTYHSESTTKSNQFYQSDHQPSSYPQLHNLMDQIIDNATDHTDNKQGMKLENLEDRRHVSPENDQSGNSSFRNGNSNSKINANTECGNEEGLNVHEGASHRSIQREVALMKFRMKRKDRCFDKKVRYESRKKLAEKRPRVKGQFVRQVPNDSQPENSSAS
ncbi:hypothetical protein RD792_013617 [Penstemon davidsonii]|uniref:Two-component response regulator-like APRR5 n=1 Tax=Penstemon davidsonii TaxID=160366 RepID=A0ABR0CU15_9LAMI|nr:hypothetical protein RD792_013617 [Penstemon davidsonii]